MQVGFQVVVVFFQLNCGAWCIQYENVIYIHVTSSEKIEGLKNSEYVGLGFWLCTYIHMYIRTYLHTVCIYCICGHLLPGVRGGTPQSVWTGLRSDLLPPANCLPCVKAKRVLWIMPWNSAMASGSSWPETPLTDAFLHGLADYIKDMLISYDRPTSLDGHSGRPTSAGLRA